jgi:hypothetical protein
MKIFNMKLYYKNTFLTIGLFLLLLSLFFLNKSAVNNDITVTDVLYIDKFLGEHDYDKYENDYADQLKFINLAQRSVQENSVYKGGLLKNKEREPKDVFEIKKGLCYDNSRVIEKILRHYGFSVRHIAFFTTRNTKNKFVSLITPHISSHAVTEVLTSRGWLVVDSNRPWVSVDINNNPISMEEILKDSSSQAPNIQLKKAYPAVIYKDPFVFVYGLYSRHGRFHPPYNFIPDINYQEFVQNFINIE